MEDNSTKGSCGCGCLGIIILVITFTFFISWIVNSCNSKDAWAGAVQTVKDYKETADSIWNE